jgi:hypothetical protein
VFCACKMIIQLFSVVLSVVGNAHKFCFMLINETPYKWRRQVRRRSCSDKETYVFDRICIYLSPTTVNGLYPRCAAQLLSLDKGE